MSFDDFEADRKTVYAVTRALEIVSEASRRLPVEMRQLYPALDWAAICRGGQRLST
ncbi:MAG: HepT-like ribonuclease domain-containing protein [Acidobacteriota bacterium]